MKEILDKISSYNLFNHLFPGALFAYILKIITTYNIIQDNVLIGLLLYYFIGLVISRVGSLVVEPILKKLSFVVFADYKKFVATAKHDPKIEILLETNNTYRTLCSLFVIVILFKLYNTIELKYVVISDYSVYALIVVLLIIFLLSYKKQTEYITKRIDANNK